MTSEMKAPRVTVVIPLYNKEAFIARSLESVLAQSFQDFEVIVMDDGSTDRGVEVAERFTNDSRVRVVRQPNLGPGAARNNAAALGTGEFIAPLDADDSWDPHYLKEGIRRLDELGPNVACITFAMMVFPMKLSSGQRWKKVGIQPDRYRVVSDTQPERIIAFLANMLPTTMIIRRSVFEKAEGFYSKNRCLFSEDAYLALRILMEYEVAFDDRPLTNRFCDASELSMNSSGVRPVEPFLQEPEQLMRHCPRDVAEVMRRVLVIRACKTASVYGYFGDSRQARDLVRKFVRLKDWRSPYFALSLIGCTPLAKWLGGLARLVNWNLRVPLAN